MQAGFIGDMFSWKRTGLAEVGEARVAMARVARVRGSQRLGGLRPDGQRERVLCSEGLYI